MFHPLAICEDDVSVCRSLKDKFQNFVRKKCQIPEESFDKIYTVYKDFFNTIFQATSSSSSMTHKFNKDHMYCPSWSIFTTNYDLCLEYYFIQRANIRLNTGFTSDETRRRMILDSQLFYEDSVNVGRPKLIKLHGSISWLIEDDGMITENYTAPIQTYLGQRYVGEMMIYPVQQKELYVEPYISMLIQLNRELRQKSTWIIIGYSFNDPVIQEIFLKNSNKNKHIIFVHPEAHDIQKNKLKNFKYKKLTSFSNLFGEKGSYISINHEIADNCRIQNQKSEAGVRY